MCDWEHTVSRQKGFIPHSSQSNHPSTQPLAITSPISGPVIYCLFENHGNRELSLPACFPLAQ